MKHTPGPWIPVEKRRWDNGPGEWLVWRLLENTTRATLIARVKRGRDAEGKQIHPFERECNACLIAAAPELLEIVREFIQGYQKMGMGDKQTVLNAQVLVARAEGEQYESVSK